VSTDYLMFCAHLHWVSRSVVLRAALFDNHITSFSEFSGRKGQL